METTQQLFSSISLRMKSSIWSVKARPSGVGHLSVKFQKCQDKCTEFDSYSSCVGSQIKYDDIVGHKCKLELYVQDNGYLPLSRLDVGSMPDHNNVQAVVRELKNPTGAVVWEQTTSYSDHPIPNRVRICKWVLWR